MSIGDKIRQRRKELGMTQAKLGKLIHKSAQVVSNWERGYTTGISADDLQHLAIALDTDLHFFVPTSPEKASWDLLTDGKAATSLIRESYYVDSRLESLIEAYPHLDEKSKDIIEAIVKLSNN